MAQWIARGPPKAEVGGSSPPMGDFFYYLITCIQVCMTRHDRFSRIAGVCEDGVGVYPPGLSPRGYPWLLTGESSGRFRLSLFVN